ncbi:hypothetical protein M885DRAFT_552604 [Pelagophyceae sp. CCMP2097]|nr:hypothetical protein M885DRAFT_552604 [Pelagophyceae sp. CCMP2097]
MAVACPPIWAELGTFAPTLVAPPAAEVDDLRGRLFSLGDRDVAVDEAHVFFKCGPATWHDLKGLDNFCANATADLVVAAKLHAAAGDSSAETLRRVEAALCFSPVGPKALPPAFTHALDTASLCGMRLTEARELVARLSLGAQTAGGGEARELVVIAAIDDDDDDEEEEEEEEGACDDGRTRRAKRRSSMRRSSHDFLHRESSQCGAARYVGAVIRPDGAVEFIFVHSRAFLSRHLTTDGREVIDELKAYFGADVVGGRATYPLRRSNAGDDAVDVAWTGDQSCVAVGAPPPRVQMATLELHVGRLGAAACDEASEASVAGWRLRDESHRHGGYGGGCPADVAPLEELRRIAAIGIVDDADAVPLAALRADVLRVCEGEALRDRGDAARRGGWRTARSRDFADQLWPVLLDGALALDGEGRCAELLDEVLGVVAAGRVLPELFEGDDCAVAAALRAALAAASAARYGAGEAGTANAFAAAATAAQTLRDAGALASVAELGSRSLRRDLEHWLDFKLATDAFLSTVVDAVEVGLRAASCGAADHAARALAKAVLGDDRPARVRCDLGTLPHRARSALALPAWWDLTFTADGVDATARFSTDDSALCAPLGGATAPSADAMRRAALELAAADEETRAAVLRCISGHATLGAAQQALGRNRKAAPTPQLFLCARRALKAVVAAD